MKLRLPYCTGQSSHRPSPESGDEGNRPHFSVGGVTKDFNSPHVPSYYLILRIEIILKGRMGRSHEFPHFTWGAAEAQRVGVACP